MRLRGYQERCVEDLEASYRTGVKRVVLVLSTGGGKTAIGAHAAARVVGRGRRVLWLAHRRELVDQAADRQVAPAGVVMAGRRPVDAPIQVASVDTLAARGSHPPAAFIVVDEAHHATAETWRAIVAKYPGAWVLGLTATPERGDGTALGNVFEALVPGPSTPDLIELGHLVDCEVIAPDREGNHLACAPADAWQKWAQGSAGFIFAKTVAESEAIAAELRQRGIAAAHVDGETPKQARDRIVSRFRRGELDVLCSVYVFTEGIDLPRARVCLLARGCGHAGTYLQMVGRVLRPHPGKKRALLIDLKGVVHAHGLPTDARTYSLEGLAIGTDEKVPPISQCPECGACWRSGTSRECLRCSYELPPPEASKVVERAIGRVQKVLRPNAGRDEKRKNLEKWRGIALERGYKPTWANVRFKAVYGHWPARWM